MKKTQTEIRILIAGQQGFFREGIRSLLDEQPEFSVVGETFDGDDVLQLNASIKPDVLLICAEALDRASIGILNALQPSEQKPGIVLLVSAISKDMELEAFNKGVHGIILQESAANSLFKCIGAVMSGQYWIPGRGISNSPQHQPSQEENDPPPAKKIKAPTKKFGLTTREMQILTLVVAGMTNREIAKRFSISEQTVKHHVTNIFDKVGAYNRLELALFAIHHGLAAEDNRQ
jgi:two-component system, NarL family, nitrate/nitrite response regulator NarL